MTKDKKKANRETLVERVIPKLCEDATKKDASVAVNVVLEGIINVLQEHGELIVVGFGTFKVKERAARNGRNPKTGETITIKASKNVSFKPSKNFKESL